MSYPTLRQTLEKFVSDEACHEHLGRIRWPTGPRCPKCKGADVIRFQAKREDRQASETLPLLILSPSIQRDSGYHFSRFSHAADRLAAGDLPHGFVEEANLGQGSRTDARRQL